MLSVVWYGILLLVQVGQVDPALHRSTVQIDVFQESVPILNLTLRGGFTNGTLVQGDGSNLGTFSLVSGAERTYMVQPRTQVPSLEPEAEAGQRARPFLLDLLSATRGLKNLRPGERQALPLPEELMEELATSTDTGEAAKTSQAATPPKTSGTSTTELTEEAIPPEFILQRRQGFWILSAGFAGLVMTMSVQ